MRIGIEAQRLFRPHKHGMDKVVQELIRNLQKIDTVNEYFIFVKPDKDTAAISSTSNFTIVEIPGGPYPLWEQCKLPKAAKAYQCDILHCTSNTAPYAMKTPLITTVHDIIYMEGSLLQLLSSKASLYQKLGNLYRRIIVGGVVKNSKRLFTVSNFEKENISTFFKLKNNTIQAIHNGVNNTFTTRLDAAHLAKVKDQYKLPENYVLHIANTDPRKNTKRVLAAFNEYLKQTGTKHKLLMLGCKETDLKILLKNIGVPNLYKHIVLTGYVSDKDLPVLYQQASLFLFPSLREGFGIPIIEAMACGVPVITSNTSSMPEVAGDAAHLIDPNITKEISDGMIKILSDETYKNNLIEKGLVRSSLFSWNSMATQVLEQYKQVYKTLKA